MNQQVSVPEPFSRKVMDVFGVHGKYWIETLPALVERYLARWNLTADLPPGRPAWYGYCGIVVPVVDAHGVPAALKISIGDDENAHEHTALSVWDGNGAVRLLAADPGDRALLMERLDGDRDLGVLPVEDAIPELADLLNRLAVPAAPQIDRMDDLAARWVDEMPRRWSTSVPDGRRRLLERAVAAARDLGPESGDLLVHTDLHYMNVLAVPAGVSSDRGTWLAIDPKPLIGDPAFAVTPMLWNRLGDLDGSDRAGALRRRMHAIADAAGLDVARVREWSIAREVENVIWYSEGGMDDDRRRSLWVAESLAG